MRFSQRQNITPSSKEIQIEWIDDELKNGIWNLIKMIFIDKIRYGNGKDFENFATLLWHKFYKLPIDEIPNYQYEIESKIRYVFFNSEWFEIYDFVEFLISVQSRPENKNSLINSLNTLLEKEFSGYRIITEKVAPISNSLEFNEVSEVLENTKNLTAYKGANIHLTKSLELISDKKNPNYRNSIKESISAVESTCRIVTGENTLGKALNKLESKGLKINKQLKSGFDKIYAYTNDKDNGIRHAFIEQANEPDFSDAKYMLISCSSFINYILDKARIFNIEIN
jgi:hypothetical protein